jgi:HEAT repeat protein
MKAEREVEGAVEIDIEDELERLKRKSTRMEAVARIGEAGAVEAVVPLLRLCKRGKKREQAAICEALVKIGEPSIRLLVEHGLEDKNAQVRECAARALGLIGQTGLAVTSQSVVARLAFDALLRCLTDESARVRLASAAALGEWRDPAAAQALVALLGDEDRKVRDQAAEALGELGAGAGEAVHEALEREESLHVQIAAAEALGEIGDAAAIASLRGVLADPSAAEELRVTAMAALAEALGEGVVPLASAALAEGDA